MSITIVSCYYKLTKSKHSQKNYDVWIKNLLLNLQNTNIIIFVGSEEYDYIKNIIENNKTIKYLLIKKEIKDFDIVKKYNNEFWNWQENIDPDKYCGRGQDCYKIWNSKFYFLKEAIMLNPYNSDKFIWNDIGNIRNNNIINECLTNYPIYTNISNNKIDIVLLNNFNDPKQLYFQNEVFFSGSMFGGGKEVILELCELFYSIFDLYVKQKLFIGCDQQILASLYLRHTDKFNCIYPQNSIIDIWFYLYKHYSF